MHTHTSGVYAFLLSYFFVTTLSQVTASQAFDDIYCAAQSTTTTLSACNSWLAACDSDENANENYYACICGSEYFNLVTSCADQFDSCNGNSGVDYLGLSTFAVEQSSACSSYSEAGYLSDFSADPGPVTSSDDDGGDQTSDGPSPSGQASTDSVSTESSSATQTPSSTITASPNPGSSSSQGQASATSSTQSAASGIKPLLDIMSACAVLTILAVLA